MELRPTDIIKKPLITTKSVELYRKLGQYTFEVHTTANKLMIRDAVQFIWNVKVDSVRVIKVVGKNKTFNRRSYQATDRKKAVITLKQGHKIEIPGLFETMGMQQVNQEHKSVEGN